MVVVGSYILLLLFTIKGVLSQWGPGALLGEAMFEPSTAALLGMGGQFDMTSGGGVGAQGVRGSRQRGAGMNQIPLVSLDTIAEFNEVPSYRKPLYIRIAEQQWRSRLQPGYGMDPHAVTERPKRYKYPDRPNGQPASTGPDRQAWKKMKTTFDRTLSAFPNGLRPTLKPIGRTYFHEATQQNTARQTKLPANHQRTWSTRPNGPLYNRPGGNIPRHSRPASSFVPRFQGVNRHNLHILQTTNTPTLHKHLAVNPSNTATNTHINTMNTSSHRNMVSGATKDLSKGSPLSPSVLPPGSSTPVRVNNPQPLTTANNNKQGSRQIETSYPSSDPSMQRSYPHVQSQGISQANTKPVSTGTEIGQASTQPGVYDRRGVKAPNVGYTPLISANYPRKQPIIESMRQAVQNGAQFGNNATIKTSSQASVNSSVSKSASTNKSSPLEALTQAAEGPSLVNLNSMQQSQNTHITSGIPHHLESVLPVTTAPLLDIYGQTQNPLMDTYGTGAWGYGQTTSGYGAFYQTTQMQSLYDTYPYATDPPIGGVNPYSNSQYPYDRNLPQSTYQRMMSQQRQQRQYEQQQQQQQQLQKKIMQQKVLQQQQLFNQMNNQGPRQNEIPVSQVGTYVNTLKKSEKVPNQVEMNTTVEPLTTQPQPILTTSSLLSTSTILPQVTSGKQGLVLEAAGVSRSKPTSQSIINDINVASSAKGLSPMEHWQNPRPNNEERNPPPPTMTNDRIGTRPDHVMANPDPDAPLARWPGVFADINVHESNNSDALNSHSVAESTVNITGDLMQINETSGIISNDSVHVPENVTSTPVDLSQTTIIVVTELHADTNTSLDPVLETKPAMSLSTERAITSKATSEPSTSISLGDTTSQSPIISTEKPVLEITTKSDASTGNGTQAGIITKSDASTGNGLQAGITTRSEASTGNGLQAGTSANQAPPSSSLNIGAGDNKASVDTKQKPAALSLQQNDPSNKWVTNSGVDHHLARIDQTVAGQSLVLAQKSYHPPLTGQLSSRHRVELNEEPVSSTKVISQGQLTIQQISSQALHHSSPSTFNRGQLNPSQRTFQQNQFLHSTRRTLTRPSHQPQRQGSSFFRQTVGSHVRPHINTRPVLLHNQQAPVTPQPRLLNHLSQHQSRGLHATNKRIPYQYPRIANGHAGAIPTSPRPAIGHSVPHSSSGRSMPALAHATRQSISASTTARNVHPSNFRNRIHDPRTPTVPLAHHASHRFAGHHADHRLRGHMHGQGHSVQQQRPLHQKQTGNVIPARGIGRQTSVARRFAGSPTPQRLPGQPVTHGLAGHRSSHGTAGHLAASQGLAQGSKYSAKKQSTDTSVLRVMQRDPKYARGVLNKALTSKFKSNSNTSTSVKRSGQLELALSKGENPTFNQNIPIAPLKENSAKTSPQIKKTVVSNNTNTPKSKELNITEMTQSPTQATVLNIRATTPSPPQRIKKPLKRPIGNLFVTQSLTDQTLQNSKQKRPSLSIRNNNQGGTFNLNKPSMNTQHASGMPLKRPILTNRRPSHNIHRPQTSRLRPFTHTSKLIPRPVVSRLSNRSPSLTHGTVNVAPVFRTVTPTVPRIIPRRQISPSRPVSAAKRLAAIRSRRLNPFRRVTPSLRYPSLPKVPPGSRVTPTRQVARQQLPSSVPHVRPVLQSVHKSATAHSRRPVLSTNQRGTRPFTIPSNPVQMSTPSIYRQTHLHPTMSGHAVQRSRVHAGTSQRAIRRLPSEFHL